MHGKVVSQRVLKATSADEPNRSMEAKKLEHCQNPWKDTCNSENIKLYIMVKGEKLPICRQCWTNLADKEVEW
jgi:hypothetical protein